jgi:beta-lactam-binding protein with PASTA domain
MRGVALGLRAAWAVLAIILLGGQARAPEPAIAASRPLLVQKLQLPAQQLAQTVPDVVGMELGAARQALAAVKLASREQALDTRGGRRVVRRQAPGAGTSYTAGKRPTVLLYHAADAPAPESPVLRMPDLSGATCDEAQQRVARLLHMRLRSCDVGSATGRTDPGRIQRQDPPAGAIVRSDSILRAWTEPAGVRVPDVTGLPARDALARLDQAGLRGAATDGGAIERWHVVRSQDPPAGRSVAPRSTVRLTLASRFVVPALAGRTCAQARELVAAAGLGDLQCMAEAAPGNPPAGRIHRQAPVAGTVLTTVRPVQAWEQPVRLELPDLVGQDEARAGERLRELRLRPAFSGPAASQGRRVMRQVPAPRTMMRPGDEVRLGLDLGVPSLIGLPCEAARERAASHGFAQLDCVPQRAGPAQPLRRVFEQSPAAGTRQAQPVALRVLVAEPVRVPDVVGRHLPDALTALQQAGLLGRSDSGQGDRDVTRQQPAAGAEVAPGSVVNLVTLPFGKVPSVVSLPLAQARGAVEQAGYRAQPDATDREGARRVTAQQPAAGTRLARGQAVALTTQVSVTVPDVLRRPLPEAQDLIAAAGLQARPDRREQASDREVRGQKPSAGATVPEGGVVDLQTVRLVSVPALAEATCGEAADRLRRAGLAPGACQVDTALPLVLGSPRVKQQVPAAGIKVDEASEVRMRAEPPPWSAPAVVGGGLLAAGGLGLMFIRRAAGAGKTWAAAQANWRVRPDLSPAVTLRLGDAERDAGTPAEPGRDDVAAAANQAAHAMPAREPWPRLRWRTERPPPQVCSRGLDLIDGEHDDHRR